MKLRTQIYQTKNSHLLVELTINCRNIKLGSMELRTQISGTKKSHLSQNLTSGTPAHDFS